jgi:hypothetical protein
MIRKMIRYGADHAETDVASKQFDPKSVLVMNEKLIMAHKRSMERGSAGAC